MTTQEFWYFFFGLSVILFIANHIFKEDKK